MLPARDVIAEIDRLQRKANALHRSLKAIRTGHRHATRLAAELADDVEQLRAHAQPAQEAPHADHPEAAVRA